MKPDMNDDGSGADWVGMPRSFAVAWGMPLAALAVGVVTGPAARTVLWTVALTWAALACLMNAKRCGRTHCRFTGPFFGAMAGLCLLYGSGALPLGAHGWTIIGGAIVVGTVMLWWGTERAYGRYTRSPDV